MKSKLLGAALLAIAGFAVADLTRAATTTLTTFLAGSAVPGAVSHEEHAPPPIPARDSVALPAAEVPDEN
jgi:hypothetical protein